MVQGKHLATFRRCTSDKTTRFAEFLYLQSVQSKFALN